MPFAQFFGITPERQRQMIIVRSRSPQTAIEKYLPRCGTQQIRPAHHLGDSEIDIINHDRKLVGEQTIGPMQNKITNGLPQVLSLRAKNTIDKGYRPVVNPQPGRPLGSGAGSPLPTGSGINRSLFPHVNNCRQTPAPGR